ncbi:MAG: FGGY family carbohydrate kinase [Bacteroidales bacterium]|jgi:sugar (pentulose or hexulose) kinase|nr:FGGY family carbohydrate kinase [Bacteroidales bacterium]
MKEKVIAIFDVGKTNKKLLLFDYNLKLVSEEETRFPEVTDDDGFECDNIDLIEDWIMESIKDLIRSDLYDLTALNFATYGATLVYLDAEGKRIGPVYNYLKPIDERIPERIYRRYGGQDEFCRRTASPSLGMLNSGMQILWLKSEKPEIFSQVKYILHFPQYLSYLITGKICSEHTSIGCHTALWDFDNMKYHSWVSDQGLELSEPIPVTTLYEVVIDGKKINAGIGIHDSSASLAPYFSGNRGEFLLASTGTWCINMNPFNPEKLTTEQLDRDCLCYMSITRQPVKSSRLFLGKMHDTGVEMLNTHFRTSEDFYMNVRFDQDLINMLGKRYIGDKRAFFSSGPESREFRDRIDLYDFKSFDEAYHQLMSELTTLSAESIRLVLPEKNETGNMYVTGGFSKNQIFVKLLAGMFPGMRVFTSEIKNATALGAALVVYKSLSDIVPEPNLGLTEYLA